MIDCTRFEGINQKFTKKLYEWENRRGIAPESSTITLLQSGISQNKVRAHQIKMVSSNTMNLQGPEITGW